MADTIQEWLNKQGGRTVTDPKSGDFNKDKPSISERVADKLVEAKELEMIKNAMSGNEQRGDSLATGIVIKSMDIQGQAVTELNKTVGKLQDEIKEANRIAASANQALLEEKINSLKFMYDQTEVAKKKAEDAGAPPSVFDSFRMVRKELQEFQDSQPRPLPVAQAFPSDETRMALQRMEQEQARELARMQDERIARDREWQLRLREFDDNSKRQWAEYHDKKQFQAQGLSGLEDLLGSVTAGINRETGVATGPPKEKTSGPPESGPHLEATITQFPCARCGEMVTVQPGASESFCDNEDCQSVYKIEQKD